MRTYLCFDFGGTFVKYAVITEEGTILFQNKYPTICDDHDAFMENIRKVYEAHTDVDGIAVSMPGLIDVEKGFAHTGGAILCLAERNVAQEISRLCGGLPVSIENDAKAAAGAELMSGVLKDVRNGAVIVIGTALGGTVVVDRKILRGTNLFAGELSYVYYNNEHMRDSGFGELPRKHEKDGRGLFTDRCTPKRICQIYGALTAEEVDLTRCPEIFERAKTRDPLAEQAIRIVCKDLAMLIFNLQCVMDPEVIAIGGGISNDELFIDILREEVAVFADHIVPGAPMPVVKGCRYRSDANLLGALYTHLIQYR
ncbi:MAG: ROK family protein [Firmicutes bacterium]|nr:ROK family protein [Bacillota bacterium]